MTHPLDRDRRRLIAGSLAGAGLAAGGSLLSISASAAGKNKINMQLGWLIGGNQLGEVAAKKLGYYEAEDIDFNLQPGGPSIDGVAIVASGRFEVGQVSSSPSLMLAVSQGLPIKCFAAGIQKHPYCFFSLKKKPIRTAQDMVGKKIGIQSTGIILLKALLAKNKIDEKAVTIVPIGADMSPLMTGQVDAVTGWLTNTSALKVLGPDRVDMASVGHRRQAVRPALLRHHQDHRQPGRGAGGLHARLGQGLAMGRQEPRRRGRPAGQGIPQPGPQRRARRRRLVMLSYSFGDTARAQGWGTMDPAVWQDQIALYSDLGQFTARTPKVDEVITMDLLKATQAARQKA